MIKEVRHVGIVVSDMEKSLKFYRDLLGLKIKSLVDEEGEYLDNMLSRKDVKSKIAKLYADNGNTLVELIMSKSHENKKDRDFFTIGASHLAFTVDDLQKTYEPDGKAKVTFCEDPDGTPIELVEVINSN